MTSKPSIILLSSITTADLVKDVSDILTKEFSLQESIVLRSADVPIQSFVVVNELPALYVAFEVTNTVNYLITESSNPVLVLDSNNKKSNELAFQIAKFYSLNSSSSDVVRSTVERYKLSRQQGILVTDATIRTQSPSYYTAIGKSYDTQQQITGTNIFVQGQAGKRGKVRDRFDNGTIIALVTTDRQSGFDRQLALVPYKGAVLNLCSSFWFEKTADIIGNHLLSTPHPYVSIAKQCKPFPIEFVVRAYMTGSTSTSIWKNYQNGVRDYCGHALPEGMIKNQSLDVCGGPLLTPTTKEEEHDRPISCIDIVKENWMTQEDLDVCGNAALAIFQRGQQIAAAHGLILVDTKYEFGRCVETGEILLIDEVHTPDSSRYWIASTYQERFTAGQEPENIDKEFLRLWFSDHCDPYKDEVLPDAPRDLVLELSRRYIQLYEMITSKSFDFQSVSGGEDTIAKAIEEALFPNACTL